MDWFKKTADLEVCKFLERGLLLNGSRKGGVVEKSFVNLEASGCLQQKEGFVIFGGRL